MKFSNQLQQQLQKEVKNYFKNLKPQLQQLKIL